MDALEFFRIVLMFGLLLVPVFLGVALWWWKPRNRVLILGCYGLIYMVLSAAGQSRIINHGGRDWCEEWHPKWILVKETGFSGRPKADFTLLGLTFWPSSWLTRSSGTRRVDSRILMGAPGRSPGQLRISMTLVINSSCECPGGGMKKMDT